MGIGNLFGPRERFQQGVDRSNMQRKTKTDRVDARTIASMLLSDAGLKPYTDTAYHNEELKSMTRYRFDKVKERAKLKSSIARLVCILFPELEKLVPSLHIASVYARSVLVFLRLRLFR